MAPAEAANMPVTRCARGPKGRQTTEVAIAVAAQPHARAWAA
jgi:hypothetical protein